MPLPNPFTPPWKKPVGPGAPGAMSPFPQPQAPPIPGGIGGYPGPGGPAPAPLPTGPGPAPPPPPPGPSPLPGPPATVGNRPLMYGPQPQMPGMGRGFIGRNNANAPFTGIPQIPGTSVPNPFAGIETGKDLTWGNVIQILSGAYPYFQENTDAYRGAANDAFQSFLGGPLYSGLSQGALSALQPTISPDMLLQMQSAGRDKVATEGQGLQDALRGMLAAQGQLPNATNPAMIGAAYNTAYQGGQSDIQQQMMASQMNQQGLVGALGAGSGLMGSQAYATGEFLDTLGSFSQGDNRFYDLLVALLGAKKA